MASFQQLPSGNWRVLIRAKGHKTISATFSSQKLAKAFAKEKERQHEEIRATGRTAAPKGSTVGHYIDDYLEYIQYGRTLQRSALFIYKELLHALHPKLLVGISMQIAMTDKCLIEGAMHQTGIITSQRRAKRLIA